MISRNTFSGFTRRVRSSAAPAVSATTETWAPAKKNASMAAAAARPFAIRNACTFTRGWAGAANGRAMSSR